MFFFISAAGTEPVCILHWPHGDTQSLIDIADGGSPHSFHASYDPLSRGTAPRASRNRQSSGASSSSEVLRSRSFAVCRGYRQRGCKMAADRPLRQVLIAFTHIQHADTVLGVPRQSTQVRICSACVDCEIITLHRMIGTKDISFRKVCQQNSMCRYIALMTCSKGRF